MQKECLETERLLLRKFTLDDAEEMFSNWASDPEVTEYLTWTPHKYIDTVRMIINDWLIDYEDDKTVRYGIVIKETGELIGGIDVVEYNDGIPEIGYCIGKRFWGNGYMPEAGKALIEYLFSLGFNTITISADSRNNRSLRVIEKLGFKYDSEEVVECSKVKPEMITLKHFKLVRN